MKIAFSTLGCPDFTWPDIYAMAKDLGYNGIEIRGLGDDIFAVKAPPFSDAQLPETLQKLQSLRLEIPCLSSGCCLKFADKQAENLAELREYIDLAAKLQTPYVRVLADLEPAPDGEVDDEAVKAALLEIAPCAEEKGVTLLYTPTPPACGACWTTPPTTAWPPCGICITPSGSWGNPPSRRCRIWGLTLNIYILRIRLWAKTASPTTRCWARGICPLPT